MGKRGGKLEMKEVKSKSQTQFTLLQGDFVWHIKLQAFKVKLALLSIYYMQMLQSVIIPYDTNQAH